VQKKLKRYIGFNRVRRETKQPFKPSRSKVLSKFYPRIQVSKMAQYIRTPCIPDFNGVIQVCQCSYHDERLIEIFWDTEVNRTLIQEFGQYFWLYSPDIPNITIHNVIEALGYTGEQIVVDWTENNQNDALLNSTVQNAELSQISIYPPNQPIPENPHQGPLPVIAEQPIVDVVDVVEDDPIAFEYDDNINPQA
jgi:hypothetical protein